MKRARMNFAESELKTLTLQPTEKGLKAILFIEADLSAEAAEHLNASYVFDAKGNAREGIKGLSLDRTLRDVDFALGDMGEAYRPDMIHAFKVTSEGTDARVSFRVHISDKNGELLEFAEGVNKDSFESAIVASQGIFDWSAENPGGTAVDMASGEKVGERASEGPLFACELCDQEVPLTEDGSGHVIDADTGEIVECKHPSANAGRKSKADGVLASASDMGVKKQRKREGRKHQDVAEEEAETAGVGL